MSKHNDDDDGSRRYLSFWSSSLPLTSKRASKIISNPTKAHQLTNVILYNRTLSDEDRKAGKEMTLKLDSE